MSDSLGVDVGGTFTDFALLDAGGVLRVWKRPSTPSDPSRAVVEGLKLGGAPGFALIHGTTVATNALLERRGACTGLIATRGLRDAIEIGRQARRNIYDLSPSRPAPLIDRRLRAEVSERVDWLGREGRPLDEAEAGAALDALVRDGIESLAVCLLFSYLNPEHERRIGEMGRARGLMVSLSHIVSPEPREFERAATTVANAFVAPVVARYLERLETAVRVLGADAVRIMQSNGGALSAAEAARLPIMTALSGPTGGLVAASRLADGSGLRRIITFDMGGTSTDVSLMPDGEPSIVNTGSIGDFPIRTPMLDIHTVGAGGGSIAWLDNAGALRVGPESAGADPGPVAYGRGDAITVTDANVLLGRIPADLRLAGTMPLFPERVRDAFRALAGRLGCSSEEAALGVVEVVNAGMARALRRVSIERGHDPADFCLVAFGGAGGLHACALADAIGARSILVPRYPGALSAIGLALADVRREYVEALPHRAEFVLGSSELERAAASALERLRGRAFADMAGDGIGPDRIRLSSSVDLQYVGQSFALRIPAGERIGAAEAARFHAAHRLRYGHSDPREPVEAVAVRLQAAATSGAPPVQAELPEGSSGPCSRTRVAFRQGVRETPIWERESLGAEWSVEGPAIVVQPDATTLVEPGWQARAGRAGEIFMRHAGP
jgi:N-methylhydantoinase A